MSRFAIVTLLCLSLAGCDREPPRPTQTVPTRAAPSQSARPPTPTPAPTSAPKGTCRWAWTESDDPSFVDCNRRPSQRAYPECFNYFVMEASGAKGCPPSHVEITVSGGPGMLESHRARVEVSSDEIRFLAGSEVLATANIEKGRVTGFRAGRKLPAFNRGSVLKP